jgi:cytoskeleton protein RodZ
MARKPILRRDRGESDLGERMMIGAGRLATIGDDLRAARLSRGEDLQDISTQLRIRYVYLEAIENGAFDSLPGPTYAIGFVRAYAHYVGLDADQMIARFKEEAAGIDAPAELTFPEPVSESRVPRGGLVVIALLLAVAAYGGWYYLSTRDMSVADLVPSVPSDFPGSPQTEGAAVPSNTADLAASAPSAASDASDPASSERASSAPTPPDAAPSDATPSDMIGAASEAARPPEAVIVTRSADIPSPVPPAPVAAVEPVPALPPAIPAVPTLASPAPSGEPSGTAETGPRVYGEGNADARIVLRARGDSWVQIRAADDSLVMTRTLRAGDSYRVPTMNGLKLMTGNAGALDILVDGQTTPSLGPFGAVRRNVVLDTERLKAGTAAPQ